MRKSEIGNSARRGADVERISRRHKYDAKVFHYANKYRSLTVAARNGVRRSYRAATVRERFFGHDLNRHHFQTPGSFPKFNIWRQVVHHRAELREVVGDVLRGAMDRATAFRHIAMWSEAHLNVSDQAQFRELAETELMALHEGNFARYQVRPAEFSAWQKKWRRG